jgi:hypothetical protein
VRRPSPCLARKPTAAGASRLLASDPVEAEARGEPAALTLRNGPGRLGRSSAQYRSRTKESASCLHASSLLFASRRCGGSVGRRRPTRHLGRYRLICRPAVAEIVGDGRPWTVLMISLLSMPWR